MPGRTGILTAATSLLPVAAVVASASCVTAGAATRPGHVAPPALAAVIDSVISTPPLNRATWGIAVWDATAGRPIVDYEAGRHFIPASNTKIVVTTAALGVLGPDYRWETPVFAKMQPGDSVAGEVVVIGRGDPTFSSRFHADDFTVTDSIAEQIASSGIRRVGGDLVIDVTFFGDRTINGAWEAGDLPWSYAPPIEAFAIGEATFGVVLTGGAAAGDGVTVETTAGPQGPQGLQPLKTELATDTAGARPDIDVDFMSHVDEVFIRGRVPAGKADTSRLAVTSPARYAGRAIAWALRERGIRVDGEVLVQRDSARAMQLREQLYAGYERVAIVRSPPLRDVVAAILRPSQNWIAEQLLKTLGAEKRGSGGWSTGLDVERRWMIDEAGIDSTGFFLRDASGLAPQNLLSAAAIVSLLEHARTASWGDLYRDALPEPGMKESTLENRLLPLRGRLRAKTGSLTNVSTLSGYLNADDGRLLIFSIMTNGSGVSQAAAGRGADRIVEAIAATRAR